MHLVLHSFLSTVCYAHRYSAAARVCFFPLPRWPAFFGIASKSNKRGRMAAMLVNETLLFLIPAFIIIAIVPAVSENLYRKGRKGDAKGRKGALKSRSRKAIGFKDWSSALALRMKHINIHEPPCRAKHSPAMAGDHRKTLKL